MTGHWVIRRISNALYAGSVHDWTNRMHEVNYFITWEEAESFRLECTWEADTYVEMYVSV